MIININKKRLFSLLAIILVAVIIIVTIIIIDSGGNAGRTPPPGVLPTKAISGNSSGNSSEIVSGTDYGYISNPVSGTVSGSNTGSGAGSNSQNIFQTPKTPEVNKITFAPPQQITGNETLKIHFINVGDADAILVQTGDHNMLIDAGLGSTQDGLAKYLRNAGVDTINYLIATHPDKDHIGGMDYIIKNFKIRDFYMSDSYKNSNDYDKLITEVKNKGLLVTVPVPGVQNDNFTLGQAQCQILAPLAQYSSDSSNNSSIVIRMTFGKKVFLFTGDAEEPSLSDIMNKYEGLGADVLKVPAHGKYKIDDFIKSVVPRYSVITCSKDNIDNSTVKKLENVGSRVYVTGRDGTVICATDGTSVNFSFSD